MSQTRQEHCKISGTRLSLHNSIQPRENTSDFVNGGTRMIDPPDKQEQNYNAALRKWVLVAIVLIIVAAGYRWLGGAQAISRLAEHESALRDFHAKHPVLIIGLAFLLYAIVTGFAIPAALLLSIAYAWYFRFWTALPLVSFASTTGATIAFLISRYLLRDATQSQFGERLRIVNEAFQREGWLYLLTLRLIPALPFFLVNILMGLTPVKTSTYWWVSQLGMLPGTIVFLWAGDSFAASVPTLAALAETDLSGLMTPRIWGAFILLAGFPYASRWAIQRFRPANSDL